MICTFYLITQTVSVPKKNLSMESATPFLQRGERSKFTWFYIYSHPLLNFQFEFYGTHLRSKSYVNNITVALYDMIKLFKKHSESQYGMCRFRGSFPAVSQYSACRSFAQSFRCYCMCNRLVFIFLKKLVEEKYIPKLVLGSQSINWK